MKRENNMLRLLSVIVCVLVSMSSYGQSIFTDGPVIKGYGKHASVNQSFALNANAQYKVVFDIAEQGTTDKVNRKINTLARFTNMHVANGVPKENIKLALVVHGKAGFDLLKEKPYKEKHKASNPNSELIASLLKHNVQIILCGQSAAYYQINNKMLQEGVKMALSAMTAHSMLQSQGYTLNPF